MSKTRTSRFVAALGAMLATSVATAQTPVRDFVPEYTFQGSDLKGYQPVGRATWRAQNGQIIGTATGGNPGWLLMEQSYQDVSFWSNFRCSGPCNAGVMFRTTRTARGLEGIFISLADGDLAPYRVVVDQDGRITSRERLAAGGGQVRIALPPNPAQQGGGGGAGGAAAAQPAPLTPGAWNELRVYLDANIIRPQLNGTGRIPAGNTADESAGYGPIALYVGAGEVQFAQLAVSDLRSRTAHAEVTHPSFRVQRLNPHHYAWDVAVADFDRDGTQDIVAGPWIYLGPDFTKMQEIYLAQTINPGVTYTPNMVTHAHDFTSDGWPDVLATESRQMVLYVNPKGANRRWERHLVLPNVTTELTVLQNLDSDSMPEIVYGHTGGYMVYAKVDRNNPTAPWVVHRISEAVVGNVNVHGMGVGDVNGDGRADILHAAGWWEQPPTLTGPDQKWTYHPAAFATAGHIRGGGGAQMAVFDVNGDRLNDVVASLNAHGWGLAWFEQKRDARGRITFEPRPIMGDFSTASTNAGGLTFSQLHSGVVPVDLDNNGLTDFVTGKRYWSHLDAYGDPDPYGPAYTVWYRTIRDPNAPGGARFQPEVIHNQSGVGSMFKVVDIDRNGRQDIISSGVWGTNILWNQMR
ncbi:MAG: DUF1080 domain-containing protein [Gemmatimonadetes bacterium]|nr:DUF1080 domain-containing protein [Gemmatimonadota bacterium]